jgi:hypothetical protein
VAGTVHKRPSLGVMRLSGRITIDEGVVRASWHTTAFAIIETKLSAGSTKDHALGMQIEEDKRGEAKARHLEGQICVCLALGRMWKNKR